MDHFEAYPDRSATIVRGDTKVSIRVARSFQVDMRVVDADQFGAALQYFTGSQAHNIATRRIAKDRGLKINEWGVFRVKGKKETYIAGATEEDVYATLDLPVVSSQSNDGLLFDAFTEKIPPVGTPVLVLSVFCRDTRSVARASLR